MSSLNTNDSDKNTESNESVKNTNIVEKNQLLIQMLHYQRKGVPYKTRFDLDDIIRIVDNIRTSPFDTDACCLWKGLPTLSNNSVCVNFYLKRHKKALHRLFYINYIADLPDDTYVRHTCKNKGICCNIRHIEPCNTRKSNNDKKTQPPTNNTDKNTSKNDDIQIVKLDITNPSSRAKLIVVLND